LIGAGTEPAEPAEPAGRTGHREAPGGGWRRMFVEPARPTSIRERPNAYWFAVATVCIGAFMGQLDASIVTVAFPTFEREFHAGVGPVTLVGLSYLLVLVTLITAVGRMSDMFGRKLVYIYGFVVFIVGSALCGLAPDLYSLIGFRMLQAVGAAMLQANSVAIVVLAVPRERLGRAIGIQGAFQALGLAIGPSVGGLLIALGGWRLIFYVNVPAGLIATVMGWYLIPRSRNLSPRVPFDWSGLAVFVPSVGGLLAGVSLGDRLGWETPAVIAMFAAAVLGTVAFIHHEHRCRFPMLDLSLFRSVPFSAGISSGLLSYMVMFGSLFVVPFYLERSLAESAGQAGLVLAVMPVLLGLTAPIAGRSAERLGARPLTMAGMLLSAAGLGMLAFAHHPLGLVIVALAVLGVGLGLFTPPNNAAIMGSVPRAQAGVASGVLNMTRGMGTAMGLAFASLVFGLVAGSNSAGPDLVAKGLTASAIFLGVTALLAMVLTGLRPKTPLDLDPLAGAD
ncbi:MAG: DHA2 family efflux MFS transporter permease subunit, partial [Acidimicrobiales bacterium]